MQFQVSSDGRYLVLTPQQPVEIEVIHQIHRALLPYRKECKIDLGLGPDKVMSARRLLIGMRDIPVEPQEIGSQETQTQATEGRGEEEGENTILKYPACSPEGRVPHLPT